MTVGLGYYLTSVTVTILILIVLSVLHSIEKRYIHPHIEVAVTLKAEDRPGLLDEVKKVLMDKGRLILTLAIRRNLEDRNLAIEANIDATQVDPPPAWWMICRPYPACTASRLDKRPWRTLLYLPIC